MITPKKLSSSNELVNLILVEYNMKLLMRYNGMELLCVCKGFIAPETKIQKMETFVNQKFTPELYNVRNGMCTIHSYLNLSLAEN